MQIAGIQRTTLIDYPGKVSATLFALGCNMKCPYCHNKQISFDFAESNIMDMKDVYAFLDERRKFIDGISISGGEPTLQPDILDFCREVKSRYGLLIKFETNGTFPKVLRQAIDEKLVDYVAMDIKTSFNKYQEHLGIDGALVYESYKILSLSKIDYELRMTCYPDFIDSDNIKDLLPMLDVEDRIYIQQCYLNKDAENPIYNVPSYDKSQLELFESLMNSKGFASASVRNK